MFSIIPFCDNLCTHSPTDNLYLQHTINIHFATLPSSFFSTLHPMFPIFVNFTISFVLTRTISLHHSVFRYVERCVRSRYKDLKVGLKLIRVFSPRGQDYDEDKT